MIVSNRVPDEFQMSSKIPFKKAPHQKAPRKKIFPESISDSVNNLLFHDRFSPFPDKIEFVKKLSRLEYAPLPEKHELYIWLRDHLTKIKEYVDYLSKHQDDLEMKCTRQFSSFRCPLQNYSAYENFIKSYQIYLKYRRIISKISFPSFIRQHFFELLHKVKKGGSEVCEEYLTYWKKFFKMKLNRQKEELKIQIDFAHAILGYYSENYKSELTSFDPGEFMARSRSSAKTYSSGSLAFRFQDLPKDLQIEVYYYLPIEDIFRSKRVSKYFSDFLKTDRLYYNMFGNVSVISEGVYESLILRNRSRSAIYHPDRIGYVIEKRDPEENSVYRGNAAPRGRAAPRERYRKDLYRESLILNAYFSTSKYKNCFTGESELSRYWDLSRIVDLSIAACSFPCSFLDFLPNLKYFQIEMSSFRGEDTRGCIYPPKIVALSISDIRISELAFLWEQIPSLFSTLILLNIDRLKPETGEEVLLDLSSFQVLKILGIDLQYGWNGWKGSCKTIVPSSIEKIFTTSLRLFSVLNLRVFHPPPIIFGYFPLITFNRYDSVKKKMLFTASKETFYL